jgi:hypothetical protein
MQLHELMDNFVPGTPRKIMWHEMDLVDTYESLHFSGIGISRSSCTE